MQQAVGNTRCRTNRSACCIPLSLPRTARDGDRLVGLIRALDDSEMLAQIHYVLVHPDYQGQGIAGQLVERIKEKYKNFLYIEGMPENETNVPFYEKHGFRRMEHGAAIQICNYSDKR